MKKRYQKLSKGLFLKKSIFRLDVVSYEEELSGMESQQNLSKEILGHYSSLDKAVANMRKHKLLWNPNSLYAYFINEIAIDASIGNVAFLSVHSYDRNKILNDECLEDYNLCNAFKGRRQDRIKHKIGDIVECISGNHLFVGIVAALPPTPEDHFPILDAMDDCYLILPYSEKEDDHYHVPCTHVFTPVVKYDMKIVESLRGKLK